MSKEDNVNSRLHVELQSLLGYQFETEERSKDKNEKHIKNLKNRKGKSKKWKGNEGE